MKWNSTVQNEPFEGNPLSWKSVFGLSQTSIHVQPTSDAETSTYLRTRTSRKPTKTAVIGLQQSIVERRSSGNEILITMWSFTRNIKRNRWTRIRATDTKSLHDSEVPSDIDHQPTSLHIRH